MIGSLVYIVVISRSDIAFPVNVLARQMSNPNDQHLAEAKRIIGYLPETRNYGLVYAESNGNVATQAASDGHKINDQEGNVKPFPPGKRTLRMETLVQEI